MSEPTCQTVRHVGIVARAIDVDPEEHDTRALIVIESEYEILGGEKDGDRFTTSLLMCPSYALQLREWLNDNETAIREAIIHEEE